MATLTISIVLPPTGELEKTGDGTSPTQAQMDEEMKARDGFTDIVSPYLKSLPERPPHRAGNVSRVELLGRDVWSELNHYLLLVTVDSEIRVSSRNCWRSYRGDLRSRGWAAPSSG